VSRFPVVTDARGRWEHGRIPNAAYTGYVTCAWQDCDRDGRAEITLTRLTETGEPGVSGDIYNTHVFCSTDHRLYYLNAPHYGENRYT
jgi:hypothetical protein